MAFHFIFLECHADDKALSYIFKPCQDILVHGSLAGLHEMVPLLHYSSQLSKKIAHSILRLLGKASSTMLTLFT
jgi:hypothetical protein